MELITLTLYLGLNIVMMFSYTLRKGDIYKAPFWFGAISLGWFAPQAIGGYQNYNIFPPSSFTSGMLFAFLCNLAFWLGWFVSVRRPLRESSILTIDFNENKLFAASTFLAIFGFYFQWKLWSLPEDMLIGVAWSGTVVKYWFLSGVFKFALIILWLMFLNKYSKIKKKYILILLIPCFYLMFEAAVFRGRRAEIMNIVAYVLIGLWFIRAFVPPRISILTGLVLGLVFINAIGIYRSLMYKSDLPFQQRVDAVLSADYVSYSQKVLDDSGEEFKNFIYQREAIENIGEYDLGLYHWNEFVFNYVPAQVIGSEFKESLRFPLNDSRDLAQNQFSHYWKNGTTSTGYSDAFASFGWLGFIKFILCGYIMGCLYKYCSKGYILPMILYIYLLNYAMHAVTHGTNEILIRQWVYFIFLVFPFLYFSSNKKVKFSVR